MKLKESSGQYESKHHRRKRRVVIRVESAETQDYVSGQQGFVDLCQEEAEELGLVSSAVSEPEWALHFVRQ